MNRTAVAKCCSCCGSTQCWWTEVIFNSGLIFRIWVTTELATAAVLQWCSCRHGAAAARSAACSAAVECCSRRPRHPGGCSRGWARGYICSKYWSRVEDVEDIEIRSAGVIALSVEIMLSRRMHLADVLLSCCGCGVNVSCVLMLGCNFVFLCFKPRPPPF